MSTFLMNFGVFDTNFDTKENIVPNIKIKIKPHNYVGLNGKCQLFLHATGNKKRERIPLRIYVIPEKWNFKTEMSDNYDINLLIGQIKARASEILIRYRLSEIDITVEKFKKDFNSTASMTSFYSFWFNYLKSEKAILAPNTFRNQKSTLKALQDHKKELHFSDISEEWINEFVSFQKKKNKKPTTISTYLKDIKKYLRLAKKKGVRFPLDVDSIKVKRYPTSRVYLEKSEVKNLNEYFLSKFCPDSFKAPLGLFLFSCYTGTRLSDCLEISTDSFSNGIFSFKAKKTKKSGRIKINKKAQIILNELLPFINTIPSEQHINRSIKEICKAVNIKKKVTFHVARHTFATLFLKMGGRIEILQKILQHSNLKDTMVYVHIIQADMDEDIMLIDNL